MKTGTLRPTLLAIAVVTLAVPAAATAQPRTEVVTAVGGNPLASGERLLDRLARLGSPGPDNRWLLRLEPGLYDLGSRSLVLRPFVDVEGSGRGVTTVHSAAETGAVVGADDVELRELTVIGEAPVDAMAVSTSAPRFAMSRVTCVARGGARSSTALANNSASGGSFRDVRALASGSPFATAVSSRGGLLHRVHASAEASDIAYAVFNASSDGELVDVTAEARSTGRFAGGIRNEGGAPLLRDVRVTASGTNRADGIVNGASTRARTVGAVIHVGGPAGSSHGIRHEFSSATTSNAEITVEGPSDAYGVTAFFSGTPVLADVTIRVVSGGNGVGVFTSGAQLTIDRSSVVADGLTLVTAESAGASIVAGASRLDGPVSAGGGPIRCAASYDGTATPLDASCAPVP